MSDCLRGSALIYELRQMQDTHLQKRDEIERIIRKEARQREKVSVGVLCSVGKVVSRPSSAPENDLTKDESLVSGLQRSHV